MTRAVFPHVPDPADARPLQSPTAHEIARIRAALPTGTRNGAMRDYADHDHEARGVALVNRSDLSTPLEFIDS